VLFFQILQVAGADLESIGHLLAGQKAVSHGFTLSNATTHTQGFVFQAPGPLILFQR
jgi:hypothetical protein